MDVCVCMYVCTSMYVYLRMYAPPFWLLHFSKIILHFVKYSTVAGLIWIHSFYHFIAMLKILNVRHCLQTQITKSNQIPTLFFTVSHLLPSDFPFWAFWFIQFLVSYLVAPFLPFATVPNSKLHLTFEDQPNANVSINLFLISQNKLFSFVLNIQDILSITFWYTALFLLNLKVIIS